VEAEVWERKQAALVDDDIERTGHEDSTIIEVVVVAAVDCQETHLQGPQYSGLWQVYVYVDDWGRSSESVPYAPDGVGYGAVAQEFLVEIPWI
jgi:hypothetical protein